MEIHLPEKRENGKYLCSGCGIQVDFSDLRCCGTCGYFFCPSCQEKHRCRITEEGLVEILPFDPYGHKDKSAVDDLFEDTPTAEDVIFFDSKDINQKSEALHTPERVFCSKCGNVILKEDAKLCPECGKYFCQHCLPIHICNPDDVGKYREKLEEIRTHQQMENERVKRIEQERRNHERAQSPDTFTKCDNCGNYFFNQEMRKCADCGAVLCPSCRESHTHSILENLWRDRGKIKSAFSRKKH